MNSYYTRKCRDADNAGDAEDAEQDQLSGYLRRMEMLGMQSMLGMLSRLWVVQALARSPEVRMLGIVVLNIIAMDAGDGYNVLEGLEFGNCRRGQLIRMLVIEMLGMLGAHAGNSG